MFHKHKPEMRGKGEKGQETTAVERSKRERRWRLKEGIKSRVSPSSLHILIEATFPEVKVYASIPKVLPSSLLTLSFLFLFVWSAAQLVLIRAIRSLVFSFPPITSFHSPV